MVADTFAVVDFAERLLDMNDSVQDDDICVDAIDNVVGNDNHERHEKHRWNQWFYQKIRLTLHLHAAVSKMRIQSSHHSPICCHRVARHVD